MSDTAQAWRLAKVEPEVKLSLGSSTIRTGESTTAAVTGFDADGEELDGSKAVITSENPDIARSFRKYRYRKKSRNSNDQSNI